MNVTDMSWLEALTWCCGGLILFCAAVVIWPMLRDRKNRGIRVSNGQVRREDVTICIPSTWLDTFHSRDLMSKEEREHL